MSIVWKPIEAAHTPAWATLSNAIAHADGAEDRYTPEDLVAELHEPGLDPTRDTLGGWHGREMVAYGQLRLAPQLQGGTALAFLGGGVHPAWRGRGLGWTVMDWIEQRAADSATARHPGAAVSLTLWAGGPTSASARLGAARGYLPARYLQDLAVDLTVWQGGAAGYGGATGDGRPAALTRALGPGDRRLVEAARRAHNEAFAGEPGAADREPSGWAAQFCGAAFRSELSRVALGGSPGGPVEDSVDSYVLSAEHFPGELSVGLVGTRPRARRRGLASLLLREVLGAAKAAGYRTATLGVDAADPVGAVRLYELAGFRLVRTDVVYEKLVAGRQGVTWQGMPPVGMPPVGMPSVGVPRAGVPAARKVPVTA